MSHNKKGYFITFEGGEGAGKTTLILSIKEYLSQKKYSFISTREPGGTMLSEEIRKLLLECEQYTFFSHRAELALFLASRAQHIEEIILPALQQKKIVLCDRFNDSSIAYQGVARNLDFEKTIAVCNFFSKDLKPDLTLYLDIDPKVGLARMSKTPNTSTGYDRLENEKIQFHRKVREGYLKIAQKEPNRFKVIDASLSPEKVLQKAISYLEDLLQ